MNHTVNTIQLLLPHTYSNDTSHARVQLQLLSQEPSQRLQQPPQMLCALTHSSTAANLPPCDMLTVAGQH
jgi:hypothetical protein